MATASKDYKAIAAKRIQRPSQVTRLPKFHIYGMNKKGKTTFCNTAGKGKVLYADPEHGTDQMKTADPNVWHIERWEDLDDYYMYLRQGDHPYEWAAIDGLTRLSNMALRYVMKLAEERNIDRQPNMVDRRDYGKSGELMRQMLTNFHNLPMGVIYTSQERMVEGSDADEDEDSDAAPAMYVPDLPKGVRGMVNSLVDVIGRIYVVKIEIKGTERKQRRLWVGESTKYDTGYRSDFTLPDMIKYPTIPKLVSLTQTGQLPATRRS